MHFLHFKIPQQLVFMDYGTCNTMDMYLGHLSVAWAVFTTGIFLMDGHFPPVNFFQFCHEIWSYRSGLTLPRQFTEKLFTSPGSDIHVLTCLVNYIFTVYLYTSHGMHGKDRHFLNPACRSNTASKQISMHSLHY